MLDKRKQGEEEAMRILKAKGISFNEKHNDEGVITFDEGIGNKITQL